MYNLPRLPNQERKDLPKLGSSRFRRFLKVSIWSIVGLVAALYIALFFYIDINQDELTFPAPQTHPHATPASVGLAFDDLQSQ